MLTNFVYIHVYSMCACNEDPDETAQMPFLGKFSQKMASNITYVNFPNITARQTLFRTTKVHARIPAQDQTI